jgi:hypothetical protein
MDLSNFVAMLMAYREPGAKIIINADYDGSPYLSIWDKDQLLVEWTFNTEMYPCDVTGLGACSIAEEEMKLYGIKKA